MTFDQTYGLAGRDYNGNTSRHGEFVTEIVYDMAPGATYWFLNYHTPDEFGLAADYIANVLRPDIVVHSNSFLFGRFDGAGWFAQKVDAATAAGVLWVNSAGNYRNRHWEGAVERRRRRRQPRRARRRQRVPRPARGHEPAGLRHLLGGRDGRPGQLLPASRSTRTPR